MENKKRILTLLPLFVLSLLGVFAFSFIGAPSVNSGNEFQYASDVCISTTGDFDGRESEAHNGLYEIVECGDNPNLVVDAGLDAIRDELAGQASFGAFDYIGLCNATAGCGAPAAGDTTLENEYTTGFVGGGRQQGTYGQLGTGNWSIYKTFTATTNSLETNKTGIFNQSTGGTLLAENTFTLVTLQNNDQLTVNWTIQVTNP